MSLTITYCGVYRVWPLADLGGETTADLSRPDAPVKLRLVTDVSGLVDICARKTALSNILLDNRFGGGKYRDLHFPERWAAQTADEKARLRSNSESGVFLIVELTERSDAAERAYSDEVNIVHNAFVPGHFSHLSERDRDRAVAAISLEASGGMTPAADKLFEYVLATDEAGRTLYPFTFGASGTAITSSTQPSDIGDRIRTRFHEFEHCPEIQTPSTLLAASVLNHGNGLLSYIFGWAALEILTKKIFATYPAPADSKPANDQPKRDVSPAEKFKALADRLSPESREPDIKEFRGYNLRRNAFFHDPDNTVPPSEGIRRLVARYIRLHLDSNKERR